MEVKNMTKLEKSERKWKLVQVLLVLIIVFACLALIGVLCVWTQMLSLFLL